MKKHRCPHCGERSFSLSDRMYMAYVRIGVLWVSKANILDGCLCAKCQNIAMQQKNNPLIRFIFFPIMFCYGYPVFPIFIISFLSVIDKLHWFVTLLSVAYYLAFLVYLFIYAFAKPIVPYNKASYSLDKHIEYKAETRINVSSSKYIKPYGVYGLKLSNSTIDEKFKENFSDGLVPAVFHPNPKGSLEYYVRIINKSAVPDDVLYDGAKFLVEDYDGLFIANGTVIKSKLDI